MFEASDRVEEVRDFLAAQNYGQLERCLGKWNYLLDPFPLECDLVHKAQRRGDDGKAARSELTLFGHIHLIGADLLRPECVGRALEVFGKNGYLLQVRQLGIARAFRILCKRVSF